jgi:hypothetical protein
MPMADGWYRECRSKVVTRAVGLQEGAAVRDRTSTIAQERADCPRVSRASIYSIILAKITHEEKNSSNVEKHNLLAIACNNQSKETKQLHNEFESAYIGQRVRPAHNRGPGELPKRQET